MGVTEDRTKGAARDQKRAQPFSQLFGYGERSNVAEAGMARNLHCLRRVEVQLRMIRLGRLGTSASLLPAFAFAQRRDVRDVVFSVPRVEGERIVQRHGFLPIGVAKLA